MEEVQTKMVSIKGVVTGDPLANSEIGRTISIRRAQFGGSDASGVPQGVFNWTTFEGAILGLNLKRAGDSLFLGTAVIIGPGLAVTAAHVYTDHLSEILEASAVFYGLGIASARVDYWTVTRISSNPESDIAYLSIQLSSPIYEDWGLTAFSMTTRAPKLGERISVVGFRMQFSGSDALNSLNFDGQLFIAAGEVTKLYMKRDQILMPYPVIEIACGALGGMSGGAVLDNTGLLLGVVSKSFETDDGLGPVSASWIIGGLNRNLDIPWPPGIYEPNVHILKVDERVLQIEGREKMTILNDKQYVYTHWDTRADSAGSEPA